MNDINVIPVKYIDKVIFLIKKIPHWQSCLPYQESPHIDKVISLIKKTPHWQSYLPYQENPTLVKLSPLSRKPPHWQSCLSYSDFLKIVGARGQNFIGSGISVVLVGPTVRLMFQFRVGWMFTSRPETK